MENLKFKIIAGIAGIAIVGGIYFTPFILGEWANRVDKSVGTKSASIQREKFKESKSYVEGMINDLSKHKREYEKASDEDKKALRIYIDDKYSNFNEDLIENDVLKKFLEDIREGV